MVMALGRMIAVCCVQKQDGRARKQKYLGGEENIISFACRDVRMVMLCPRLHDVKK